MLEFYKEHKDEIGKLLQIVLIAILFYIFFAYIFTYVAPFVFGFLISLMLAPVVNFLIKKLKFGVCLSAFFSIILLVFIIGFLGTWLVSSITQQGIAFMENVPIYMDDVNKVTDGIKVKYNNFFNVMPFEVRNAIDMLTLSSNEFIKSALGSGMKEGSKNLFKVVPNFFMSFILCIISTFFFIKDKSLIRTNVAKKLPNAITSTYVVAKEQLIIALAGYFKAEIIIMSIIATITISGLLLIGYPYALFLGLIIAVVDALPIFGSGFIIIPWLILSLASGNIARAIGLFVIYCTIILTRQTLEPRILGTQLGIHPLIMLMSIYIGFRLFGVFGLILGPIFVVVVKKLT